MPRSIRLSNATEHPRAPNEHVMPFARLQLRPLCILAVSVDYVLRFAKNSSSMAFIESVIPGIEQLFAFFHQFLSWRGTYTDVTRLGTFPFAPISPTLKPYNSFTSRLSLLVVNCGVVLIRRKAFPEGLPASYTTRSITYSPFAIHLNPEP